MSRLHSLKSTILAVIFMAMAAGCAPLKISKPNVWPFASEEQPGMPTRIVASWTDTVLYQPDRIPMRGFGGRLLFYTSEKAEPVKVEGTLTVYVFDETDRDPNNVRPDRKYVFTKDQLPTHYSKSKLGHSYSVWIPWDETGGPQKELSLIVRFTPEKGGVVVGEQTKHLLPGKTQIIARNTGGGVLQSAAPRAAPIQSLSIPGGSAQTPSNLMPLPPVNPGMQDNDQTGMNQSHRLNTTTINLPPQSSLKNALVMGDAANPMVGNPVIPPPGIASSAVNHTEVINAAGQSEKVVATACYPESTAVAGAAINSSNQESQPYSPPDRFVLGRPRASYEPTTRPNRDRAPRQPLPSGQGYFPETTLQPATVNGSLPSVVSAGTIQK